MSRAERRERRERREKRERRERFYMRTFGMEFKFVCMAKFHWDV